ncbi:cell cycle control tyrosine phosphatase Mih1 [Cordyceps militaris]|uniref:Cell cycle control tyrosine phosphatase Mih1 n=1 Tax=Cordyceps militaris TaxID=73501 RepID=A0A2H4SKP5_CORMI|nr:cell cycle control tyrosine phosphatase Mih1 [Cordyceps militaris]
MDGAKQYGICGVTAGKGICGNPGTAQAAGRIRGTARTASDGSKSYQVLGQWGEGAKPCQEKKKGVGSFAACRVQQGEAVRSMEQAGGEVVTYWDAATSDGLLH